VHCDVLVLGSGPAGFYCALNCARLGRKTILVERDRLGGTGFRWGCLPVKMMLDRVRAETAAGAGADRVRFSAAASVITDTARRIQEVEARIRERLSAAGAQVIQGEGRFIDPNTFHLGRRRISAGRIVIATGTEPAGWPGIPLDGRTVLSHREILALTEVPKHLLILGADVEGIELACLFARLGGRVTVIEKEDRILPGTDPDLAAPIRRDLLGRGVELKTGAEVRGCTLDGGATLSLSDGSLVGGVRILVTGTRRPNFPEGLERIGVDHDEQKIVVNDDLQTSCDTIYAVGDVNGITGMAHAAIQQGLLAARRIAGQTGGSGHTSGAVPSGPPYPRAIYTLPEIAGAGCQESELDEKGTPYRRLLYRLADTWRGFSKGIDEGFVKVLAGEDLRILGIWICGADASEQASLFGPLLSSALTVEELRDGLILHPTLGEAALEAVLEIDQ
jgi:dihydrolipoamide dehydrogenase